MNVQQKIDKQNGQQSVKFEQVGGSVVEIPRVQSGVKQPRAAAENQRRSHGWVWLALATFIIGSIAGIGWDRYRQRVSPTILAINGSSITQNMLFERMQATMGATTIQQLIQDELQLQYAQSLGVAPTDAQVDAAMDKLQKQPDFAEKLLQGDQTLGDYRWRLRVRMAQAFVMGQGINISQTDMMRFYREQTNPSNPTAAYYTPATCTIAAIITSQPGTAQRAYQTLMIGTPFDVVARQYSQDKSASNGGVLPTIVHGRSGLTTVPGMEESFFNLRIGQMMPPRRLMGAWWVVRCMSKTPSHTDKFDDVKDDCRLGALFERGQALHGGSVNADFGQYARSAKVQAFWPQYEAFSSN